MPLPWNPTHPPLMLAPMQGLTNRALRSVFAETAKAPARKPKPAAKPKAKPPRPRSRRGKGRKR